MSDERIKLAALGSFVFLVGAGSVVGNIITGEGMPNPNPVLTNQWGELPAGRTWGHTAGIDIDPTDGHVWAYERCGSAAGMAAGGPVNCDTNPVDPIFKFDRNTGEVLANFGAGIFTIPHGIHADHDGNVWVTDFATNADGTKGQQVHKFSPDGELLMSLGVAGQSGTDGAHFNQPNDVVVAADGSIFVSDGHNGQGMTTANAVEEGRQAGQTGRIMKFAPDGTFITQWGQLGTAHGQFRTPHALEIDSQERLWVADRGNHRLEIFDLDGNYLESQHTATAVSAESLSPTTIWSTRSIPSPTRTTTSTGLRAFASALWTKIASLPLFRDIPPRLEVTNRPRVRGVAVAGDGTVFVAEGPASIPIAGGAFSRYSAD